MIDRRELTKVEPSSRVACTDQRIAGSMMDAFLHYGLEAYS